MSKPLVSYAQNREDLILFVLLHKVKTGFYVDVGANDPVIDSVTKFFYDKGWRGINIEPIPFLYEQISKNRRRDINVNVAVSNKEGVLELREYGHGKHGWSTLSADIKRDHISEKDHKDYKVKVTTLRNIFRKYQVKDIDFLKIDVEGFEYEVLSSNDWSKYKPKVIVVEDTYPEKWLSLLSQVGYQEVYQDGLNRYFVRNDLKDVCTMKDYKQVLLSGASVITAQQQSTLRQLSSVEKWLRATQQDLGEIREQHLKLSKQWTLINENPSEVLGIKKLYSALLKRIKTKLKQTIRTSK